MQHLDEGTIHAWLDGQLPPDEARAVEAHVAECRPCADAVAEARGLIAASSRILTALDAVPREVVPKPAPFRSQAEARGAGLVGGEGTTNVGVPGAVQRAQRRWFAGPSLAAAAVVVVAIGTVAIMRARQPEPLRSERIVAAPTVSGPAVMDSAPMQAGANVPASAPAGALGARQPVVAAVPAPRPAPPAASNARDAANERADVAAGAPARQLAAVQRPPAAESIRQEQQRPTEQETQVAELKKNLVVEPAQRSGDTSQIQVFRGRLTAAPAVVTDSLTATRAKEQAQTVTGSVHGRITDANGTGLANVQVVVAGTNIGAVTSESGDYTIGGVAVGAQNLNVRRIGYQVAVRNVTIVAGQSATADVVLNPAVTELSNVVVTGAAAAPRRVAAGSAIAKTQPAVPLQDSAPGAPVTAVQSNAIGCYELGITSPTPTRSGFLRVPRQIALDGDIVPANADGIWYRARDLSRTNPVADGLWRPAGTNMIEIEWTYGSKTGRLLMSGSQGPMLRGNVEEIDRASATGEAGSVVATKRPCQN